MYGRIWLHNAIAQQTKQGRNAFLLLCIERQTFFLHNYCEWMENFKMNGQIAVWILFHNLINFILILSTWKMTCIMLRYYAMYQKSFEENINQRINEKTFDWNIMLKAKFS